ncbi:hypothetical protein Z043_109635 [Scleropages formosus]|uniref:Tyrosine-protein kinase ephrin type A/B receptor-like domain-containing protein n=1 Tax=Scleropages formosus TaxID=113540 RepID=A0A0P7UQL0_SCLFO|nr:hypothetical protein Z043_109635 [Scleropages formosus]
MCPQGYYCEEGTATPHGTPCPPGTAGSQLGQTSKAACKRCAEGRYCPAGSVFPGLPCARGRFCPAGTLEEVSCPKGAFTPHQGAAILMNPNTRVCRSGVKDCLKCPPGFYCPEGTSDPIPCQPGTFNPLEGQDEAADCRACYPGKACTQTGLKAPDVDCLQGTYMKTVTSNPSSFSCPPGSSRPNAPANACPPGTMSERTDLADRSQCQPCPPRYACPRGTGGAQRPALSCFAGHYCPPGTMFPTQHKCPAGTWSQRSGLESEGECGPCPRGWYCLTGAGAPSGRCSSGHYCPEGTQYGSQFPCPAGTYSTRVGNGGKEDCMFCTEGAYCPPGSSKPTPCPPTTFRREKGGQRPEDCSVCPAGYFCPLSGTVRPSPCGAGSYSVSVTVSYSACPPAEGEGSASCLPCQRGHYCSSVATSREAMLSQMVCPAGLHCSQGLDREPQRSATLCPKGFYCPGGSIEPNPIPCPNGTYSGQPGLRELKECTPCPAGLFCFSQQPWEQPLTEPTGSCPDGYYCPVGTGEPRSHPCPAGVFRNHSQGHRGELCVPCPPGRYCGSLATHTPTVCPQGSSVPTACEEGTYGDRPALQSAFECTPCGWGKYCSGVGRTEPSGVCEEGFYCRGRARSATPAGGLCPTGSFCPPGSALPSPCPPGTFSNNTGLGNALQCVRCPPGFYCSGSNNTSPTGPCSPGYYCTGASVSPVQYEAEEGHFTRAGASRAEPCPFGTFQPARGQGFCLECPRGHLCNRTGLARPPLCPPGHFCPAGSTLPHLCPPGSYLGQVGGESVQHCGPCDAGMFCRNPGLLAPQGPCSPGFYCLGGASTATPIPVLSCTGWPLGCGIQQ